MRTLIEKILASESVNVDDAVFPLVIRAGGGSPRDTLSVLDQLPDAAEDNRVHYQRALALLGATDVALIDDAIDALAAGDGAALFEAVEASASTPGTIRAGSLPICWNGSAISLCCKRFRMRRAVASWMRPMTCSIGCEIRLPASGRRRWPGTQRWCTPVWGARGATARDLLLEVMCARLLLPSASDTESALLQRIERIETGWTSPCRPGRPRRVPPHPRASSMSAKPRRRHRSNARRPSGLRRRLRHHPGPSRLRYAPSPSKLHPHPRPHPRTRPHRHL